MYAFIFSNKSKADTGIMGKCDLLKQDGCLSQPQAQLPAYSSIASERRKKRVWK